MMLNEEFENEKGVKKCNCASFFSFFIYLFDEINDFDKDKLERTLKTFL